MYKHTAFHSLLSASDDAATLETCYTGVPGTYITPVVDLLLSHMTVTVHINNPLYTCLYNTHNHLATGTVIYTDVILSRLVVSKRLWKDGGRSLRVCRNRLMLHSSP